ncbi:MAG: hypothetical protein ACNS62_08265 [Candidatus Cyclobacteriaceae bacterium M3_2C_046]
MGSFQEWDANLENIIDREELKANPTTSYSNIGIWIRITKLPRKNYAIIFSEMQMEMV